MTGMSCTKCGEEGGRGYGWTNGGARNNLGHMESQSGNMEQSAKHWKIAASAGQIILIYTDVTTIDA
jgi:hypothetical protein